MKSASDATASALSSTRWASSSSSVELPIERFQIVQ